MENFHCTGLLPTWASRHVNIGVFSAFFRFSDPIHTFIFALIEACLLLPTVLSSKIRNSLIVSIFDYKLEAGNKKGIFRDFGQSITFLFLYIEASKSTCMFTFVCAICVCKRKLQGCSILKLVVRVVFTFSDKYGDLTKTIPDD